MFVSYLTSGPFTRCQLPCKWIVPSKLCCFFPFSPSALTSYSHSIFPNAGVSLPQGPKHHPRSPLPSFHCREARLNVPLPVARPGEQLGSRLGHEWPVSTQPPPARGTARLQGEERRACLYPAHDATVMWGCVCVCVCMICVLCAIYVYVYICVFIWMCVCVHTAVCLCAYGLLK